MMTLFRVERSPKTRSRKLPWLPRFGVVVDFGGRRFSYRQVPLLETVVNLLERGPTRFNVNQILMEQFYEICLPSFVRRNTVDVEAKTISTRVKRLRSFGK
jgi:hypothetical protein